MIVREGRCALLLLLAGVAACCAPGPQRFPWPTPPGPTRTARDEVSTLRTPSARVLVRQVRRPTRANLDWAISVGSPILRSRGEELSAEELAGARVPPQPFGGFLDAATLTGSLAGTPLTRAEQGQPLAFGLLVDYLSRWRADEATGLEEARGAIREERWGLKGRPGVAMQEAVELFVHRAGAGQPELWVRIELAPWAKIFRDGGTEIYGRLRGGLLSTGARARVQEDYLGRPLAAAEVRAWGNDLASHWYPTLNTDLVDATAARRWPLPGTEPDLAAELRGWSLSEPTLVLRGKPEGRALYTILRVPGLAAARAPAASRPSVKDPHRAALKRFPVTSEAATMAARLQAELDAHGGSLERRLEELAPHHQAIKLLLGRRPEKLKALIGRDGFLFYRRSLEYVMAGDLQKQPAGKNPFPAIVAFHRYLKRLGVDFLLVPVPSKLEVFPDKLLPGIKPSRKIVLAAAGRQLLLELARAGVDVVDLLPTFLDWRAKAKPGDEPLYQAQDTHWTNNGLRLAAGLIGARIAHYPWLKTFFLPGHAVFNLRRAPFTRFGDLHSRLTPAEQRRYRPVTLVGEQVLTPDGKPYEDDEESPIVVLGDSFTGVYQRTDCQSAGVTAHLARHLGHTVDLVMSYGGGPNVRRTLLTRGEADLARRRLLIWIFAARDLFDYWEDWELIDGSRPTGARP